MPQKLDTSAAASTTDDVLPSHKIERPTNELGVADQQQQQQQPPIAAASAFTPSIRRRGVGGRQYNDNTVRFTDHFTLSLPTSDVKYRGDSIHVYDLRASQIQFVTTTPTSNSSWSSVSGSIDPSLKVIGGAVVKDAVTSSTNNTPNEKQRQRQREQQREREQQEQQSPARRTKVDGGEGDNDEVIEIIQQPSSSSAAPAVCVSEVDRNDDDDEKKNETNNQPPQYSQSQQFYDIEMRHIPNDRATGLSLLRLTYTVVALFFTGIVSFVVHRVFLVLVSMNAF
jgi:hypothetical protein